MEYNMKLQKGRPACEAGRLEKELRTYDFLDQLGVEYERIDHEVAMTMEACKDIDEALGTAMCKNLLVCNSRETRFYLLMIVGDKMFKTREISDQIGSSRLSFAKAEYMEKFLDITPGSLTVLGLMNDKEHQVGLLIDEALYDTEFFGCHPCINTSSLRIRTKDLFKKILPATGHEPVKVKV